MAAWGNVQLKDLQYYISDIHTMQYTIKPYVSDTLRYTHCIPYQMVYSVPHNPFFLACTTTHVQCISHVYILTPPPTHTLRFRGLDISPWSQFNADFFQLVIEETQLPLHLVTATHLIDELALEGIHVSIHLCVCVCVDTLCTCRYVAMTYMCMYGHMITVMQNNADNDDSNLHL